MTDKEQAQELALELYKANKTIDDLKDTLMKNEEWKRKAKFDAGFDFNYSFDYVWKKVLEKSSDTSDIFKLVQGLDVCCDLIGTSEASLMESIHATIDEMKKKYKL